MSSTEIHASLGRMLAAANGFGAASEWTISTVGAVACLGILLVCGCSLLVWLRDSYPTEQTSELVMVDRRARRLSRAFDEDTAAIVRICFRSWLRPGRWTDELGSTLAGMRLI